MSSIITQVGSIEIKKNKSKFAFGINYKDNNGDNKHITLCYIKNFPMINKSIDLDKLKCIFDIWFNVVNDIFDDKGKLNYEIRKSNSLVFGDENEYFLSNTSIWFKSVNKYSLDSMIIEFNKLINEKLTFNENTVIEMPHMNQKIYAHSDFSYKVNNDTKKLVPITISLINVNII